jgi:ribosomal protein L40E
MQELGAKPDRYGAEALRCADCGGLNAPDAEWCGQCLRRFESPSPGAAPDPGDIPPLPTRSDPLFDPLTPPADSFDPLLDPLGIGFGSVDAPTPAHGEPRPGAASPDDETHAAPEIRRHGAFSVAGKDISWTCDRCDTDNELSAQVCRVCGTGFGDTVGPAPEKPQRDPNTVALVSLLYPGAGHAYLGLWSQAIARAAMSTWVVAVALVAALQKGVPGSAAIVVLFGLTAFALWALSAHDAYREAAEDPRGVILRPRMFLFLTIGLLFLLFLSLIVAGISAGR